MEVLLENIDIANRNSIDYTEKRRIYFRILFAYPLGSYYVYKEYPSFSEQDALDVLADWMVDNAPGYCPDDARIAELIADAQVDNRANDEEYVNDFYMRAGNDGHYIDIPALIETVSEPRMLELEARP
jgi:hypothetical protein